ncbi:MAG: hypothetical protein U9P68_14140 [Pseudomonadota bacterium]|nr:hypothetical protein [Pseudomonadota bacterium]
MIELVDGLLEEVTDIARKYAERCGALFVRGGHHTCITCHPLSSFRRKPEPSRTVVLGPDFRQDDGVWV